MRYIQCHKCGAIIPLENTGELPSYMTYANSTIGPFGKIIPDGGHYGDTVTYKGGNDEKGVAFDSEAEFKKLEKKYKKK